MNLLLKVFPLLLAAIAGADAILGEWRAASGIMTGATIALLIGLGESHKGDPEGQKELRSLVNSGFFFLLLSSTGLAVGLYRLGQTGLVVSCIVALAVATIPWASRHNRERVLLNGRLLALFALALAAAYSGTWVWG
jgi:hypothetical protein